MGTKCSPILADLFLYSHDIDIILGLLKKSEKEASRILLFNVPLIDDVLSLNNSNLGDFVDRIEVEIKGTTYTARSASYLDLHLEIDSEGRLRTKLYDKRET